MPVRTALAQDLAQMALPIAAVLEEVSAAVLQHPITLLQAPPGAGKSTVLPLFLQQLPEMAGQKVLVLQPRRLAARMVAQRLAEASGDSLGGLVGYRVRFEQKVGPNTLLEVLTEGLFTRMLLSDAELEGVGLVIFDEFHERSIQADLALAICREIQEVLRPDLKLLIMSATLETEQLASVLGNGQPIPVISSEGKVFPLEVVHSPAEESIQDASQLVPATLKLVKQVLKKHTEGDVLVFLPGVREISKVQAGLEEVVGIETLPLYADLPIEAQQKAIQPAAQRKVILATSIAETSVTIPGVRVVVDSGFGRMQRYEPKTGMSSLETVRITQAAATQRAGRAARQGAGTAYRMWSTGQHLHLEAHRWPEILQAELSSLVLEVASWSTASPEALPWVTAPPKGNWLAAVNLQQQLGLLEGHKLTQLGKEAMAFSTHPRLARMLAYAKRKGWAGTAADLAAILEERDFLGTDAGADISLRMEALVRARKQNRVDGALSRVQKLSLQWHKILGTVPASIQADPYVVGACVALAYPDRIAKQLKPHGEAYKLVRSKVVNLTMNDALTREPWLAVAHLDVGIGRIYEAAPLDPELLKDLQTEQEWVGIDKTTGRLVAEKQWLLGDLVVRSTALTQPAEDTVRALVGDHIKETGINCLNWDEAVQDWQARIGSLSVWMPEGGWPDCTTESLLAGVDDWLLPYLPKIRNLEELKKVNLLPFLEQLLTYPQQQELARLAPTHLEVPSGSRIRIQYHADGDKPILAVRLQELFGLRTTPTVCAGRVAVLLHLLSPGYKPVQVTQDLTSFWDNTYPEVKKELARRYPKHSWPVDPWTAEAVRGVKKKVG